MFADTKTFSAFAVDDLAQARKFYGETLGSGFPSSTDCSPCTWRAAATPGCTRSPTTPRPPTPSSCSR